MLVNLVVNARDAMPKGGTLVIETSEVILDEEYARTHPGVKPGEYVLLAVSDSGTGLSPQVKEHLFEPFFTTKGKEKGTGLGLATSHAIVKQNGGHIGIYSELGKGATFKIYLPVVSEKNDNTSARKENIIHKGDETILLVEDEEAVRNIIINMLQRYGYKVIHAANGEEAIKVFEDNGCKDQIKMVLTDMVMPQMTGVEMMAKIHKHAPEIKVLFMSGYTDNFVREEMIGPSSHFIQKPLSISQLTTKIREVLGKK